MTSRAGALWPHRPRGSPAEAICGTQTSETNEPTSIEDRPAASRAALLGPRTAGGTVEQVNPTRTTAPGPVRSPAPAVTAPGE
jgi:hypothetical protein